jgi:predicted component of type VI protein secretion system
MLFIVRGGKWQGRKIPLRQLPFVIGRDPHCQLRPAHLTISKRHCALELHEGQLVLRDYGSTNGTVINGHVFRGGTIQLLEGDMVSVGPLVFTLQIQVADQADPTVPEPTEETPETPPTEEAVPLTDDTEEKTVLTIDENDVVEDEPDSEPLPVRKPVRAAKQGSAASAADQVLRSYQRKER